GPLGEVAAVRYRHRFGLYKIGSATYFGAISALILLTFCFVVWLAKQHSLANAPTTWLCKSIK
ncbi:hypothetical protein, partial [Shinella sp.]|uniref:hypothetical protein n=1 Tax=Shinella sp. TaxID=1870904 RepID=UPI002897183E